MFKNECSVNLGRNLHMWFGPTWHRHMSVSLTKKQGVEWDDINLERRVLEVADVDVAIDSDGGLVVEHATGDPVEGEGKEPRLVGRMLNYYLL